MGEQTQLEILVELKDEVSKGFKGLSDNVEKESKKLNDSFKVTGVSADKMAKFVAGAAVAIGATAVAFGVSAVKAFTESQVAMAKVDATLKAMGDTTKKTKDAILAAADAAVRLGFDDEDTAQSITRFYQATKSLTEAQRLNSIAMNLARGKSIDLGEASRIVSLALAGSTRELKSMGFAVKEGMTGFEALAVIQKSYAGQADAFANILPGQLESINIQWQNIKKTIGETLVTALTPFVKEFNDWLGNPDTKAQLDEWVATFKSWAEVVIPTLVDAFKILVSWAQNLYDVMVKIGEVYLSIVDKVSSAGDWVGKVGGDFIRRGQVNLSGMRASGGPVSGGGAYVVGEKGPEIFVPPSGGGTILPNGVGGSSTVINVNVGSLYGTDRSAAMKFADLVARQLNQNIKLRTI